MEEGYEEEVIIKMAFRILQELEGLMDATRCLRETLEKMLKMLEQCDCADMCGS